MLIIETSVENNNVNIFYPYNKIESIYIYKKLKFFKKLNFWINNNISMNSLDEKASTQQQIDIILSYCALQKSNA